MLRTLLKRTCAAALPLIIAGSAGAQSLGELVQGQMLTGWRSGDGSHVAAIRLDLAPGWKTYWRAPGDAGIPPQFDWAGSENLASVTAHWPVPILFDENGMRSVGYQTAVTIPLTFTPREAGREIAVTGTMQIGVCRDICVPVTLDLNATLPPSGRGAAAEMVRDALEDRPMTEAEAGVGRVICEVTPIADGVRVSIRAEMPSIGAGEQSVVEFADPSVWVSEPETTRAGGWLTAVAEMVPPEAQPFAMARSGVRMTVISGTRAVDIQGCTGS